jgi:HPt (histidine-containing phosphotransfer) domain-containing protein
MSTDRFETIAKAKKVIQQIGLELAFVDAVKENGVDGINDLVRQLESALDQETPEPIVEAMTTVRQWIDQRVAADNKLSAVTIARLGDWQPWVDAALMSWEYELPYPPSPEGWRTPEGASTAPLATSSSQAALVPSQPTQAPAVRAQPAPASAELLPEQTVGVVPSDADAEMLQIFCAEAQDLLQDIEQGVLVLEVNPTDSSSLDSLFRAFHTFKGNVGVMKLMVLQQLAHELESMLDAARRGKYRLVSESITVILAGADILKRFVSELSNQIVGVNTGRTIDLPIPQLIHDVHALLAGESPATAKSSGIAPPADAVPAPPPLPPALPLPGTTGAGNGAESPRAPAPLPVEPPPPSQAPAVPIAPAVAKAPAASQAAAPVIGSGIVRVDTLKLDGLIDLVGELVIAQSMVVQSPEVRAHRQRPSLALSRPAPRDHLRPAADGDVAADGADPQHLPEDGPPRSRPGRPAGQGDRSSSRGRTPNSTATSSRNWATPSST